MHRSLAFRFTLCVALSALTLLAACSRGSDGAAPVGPAAGASAPADAALAQDLERIERAALARPAQLEQELRARGADLPAGSAAQLDVIALRGMLAALMRDRALSGQLAEQLRQWPAGRLRATAVVAAASVNAEYVRQNGDLREARNLLLALDKAQVEDAGPVYRWRYYHQLAAISGDAGELDASLTHGHAALRLAEQIGQPWREALALLDLAFTTYRADTPARARQLIAQALAEAQKDPDPMTLNRVYTMRGILYSDEGGDPGIVLQSWSDALDQAVRAGADSVRALNLANLADYHLHQGHPARALELAQQALPLARATRNTSAESTARANIGLAKILMGRVAEGREDVRAPITLEEQQGALAYASTDWKELGEYLERAGDLPGAVAAYREHRRMSERVLREETRKLLLEAQERQDAEQRARDIELLNRGNALKAEQVRQRNLALALWAALGGCVVVSLGLLYQAFRRVRRTNEALAHSNASLKRQSETDPLTGLANRRHFQAAIKGLSGQGGLSASVFLIDIDHFKRLNDEHGHPAGDAALRHCLRIWQAGLREVDCLGRIGGEEFCALLPLADPADLNSAAAVVERLRASLAAQPLQWKDMELQLTASFGVALPATDDPAGDVALARADAELYRAKAEGRNRVCVAQPLLSEAAPT